MEELNKAQKMELIKKFKVKDILKTHNAGKHDFTLIYKSGKIKWIELVYRGEAIDEVVKWYKHEASPEETIRMLKKYAKVSTPKRIEFYKSLGKSVYYREY